MLSKTHAIVVMALAVGLMGGCSTGSVTKEENDTLFKQAQAQRQEWNKVDPQLEAFAKKGNGFAFSQRSRRVGLSSVGPVAGVLSTRKVNTLAMLS